MKKEWFETARTYHSDMLSDLAELSANNVPASDIKIMYMEDGYGKIFYYAEKQIIFE